MKEKENAGTQSLSERIVTRAKALYKYCTDSVWSDPRNNIGTQIIKTINLTLSAFFNSTLQTRSMALTYSTVLAIVPAFALLVAIGRGFGLQDTLQDQLYNFFPSQSQSISTALNFVDSYLNSATKGVFVGIGIVLLLWTIISLLSSIEETFNSIWDIKTSRTIYQKITDYISICLIIPVLMICSSGISILLTEVVQETFNLPILTPVLNVGLEMVPFLLCWLAFTLSYYLIPNTKVKFKYAAVAGVLAALAFQTLQMLFLNGQIYVSKYNAIYGSLSFLPLMLIWLQLSWLVLLTGCMISYSMQNVFTFNLVGNGNRISNIGSHNIALIVMAVATQRFVNKEKPMSQQEIAVRYYLPIRLVGHTVTKLRDSGLIYEVKLEEGVTGIAPAVEPDKLTVAEFLKTFDNVGTTYFIEEFRNIYKEMLSLLGPIREKSYAEFSTILIKDLPMPTQEEIKKIMIDDAKDIKK